MFEQKGVAFGNLDVSAAQHPTRKDENGDPLLNFDKLCPIVAAWAIRAANQIPKIMSDLTNETEEAKKMLADAVSGIGSNVEKLKPLKKAMIDELRGLRMTTSTEVAAMIKPLEDIRKFFLGPEHEKEIERLREFVDLCERLEKLKQSGFLDSVADTMLKLS